MEERSYWWSPVLVGKTCFRLYLREKEGNTVTVSAYVSFRLYLRVLDELTMAVAGTFGWYIRSCIDGNLYISGHYAIHTYLII